jgi:hypothetical protein
MDEFCKKIYTWLYIASFCKSGTECSPHLSIYIYLTNYKKQLPTAKHAPIEPEHANTGYTLACPTTTNEIYIYRREEWFKVFIHETIHSLGMDFANMPESKSIQYMQTIFPVKYDLRFYEAYTETWATILYLLFVIYEKHSSKLLKYKIQQLEELCIQQQKWSILQVVKILNHFDLKYGDLYSKTNHPKRKFYKENTSVFSYYILKSIFFYSINTFVEWCIDHNADSSIKGLCFVKTEENIRDLFELIRKNYTHPDYLAEIQFTETHFDSLLTDDNSITMRMIIDIPN